MLLFTSRTAALILSLCYAVKSEPQISTRSTRTTRARTTRTTSSRSTRITAPVVTPTYTPTPTPEPSTTTDDWGPIPTETGTANIPGWETGITFSRSSSTIEGGITFSRSSTVESVSIFCPASTLATSEYVTSIPSTVTYQTGSYSSYTYTFSLIISQRTTSYWTTTGSMILDGTPVTTVSYVPTTETSVFEAPRSCGTPVVKQATNCAFDVATCDQPMCSGVKTVIKAKYDDDPCCSGAPQQTVFAKCPTACPTDCAGTATSYVDAKSTGGVDSHFTVW